MPFREQPPGRPLKFVVQPNTFSDLDCSPCALYLRIYDVDYLLELLRARRIDIKTEPSFVKRHTQRKRAGDAPGARPWFKDVRLWRDPSAAIPQGLFILCCETAAIPNAPPSPYFRTTDGSLHEPADFLADSIHKAFETEQAYQTFSYRVSAYLPATTQDRLAEAGANFRESGSAATPHYSAHIQPVNRSAGVRRLIEAHRMSVATERTAPLVFRGAMLSHRHTWPTVLETLLNQEYLLESSVAGIEAFAKRYQKLARGPHPFVDEHLRAAKRNLARWRANPSSREELLALMDDQPHQDQPQPQTLSLVPATPKTVTASSIPTRPRRKPVRAADISNEPAFSQERLACTPPIQNHVITTTPAHLNATPTPPNTTEPPPSSDSVPATSPSSTTTASTFGTASNTLSPPPTVFPGAVESTTPSEVSPSS